MAGTRIDAASGAKKHNTKKKPNTKSLSEESMAGAIAFDWYVICPGRSLSQAQRKAMIQPAIAIRLEDLSEDLVPRP
ncbi:hypothetical protein FIE12Z_632 [Fusarium flagelliforme]|uniref:Uncharacterized protein n=1 Tax=Fusarium flagelliforme TaxID=2675880 RepID=A0A395N5F2_9HYPO|nr:hypothetical protein FIE12Z_632 [Fusarium flagelliforme]